MFQGEKWNSWAWRLDEPDQHLPQPALLPGRSLTTRSWRWLSKTLKYTTNSERNIFSILKINFSKMMAKLKIGFSLDIVINFLIKTQLIKLLWYSFSKYYLRGVYDNCNYLKWPQKIQHVSRRKIFSSMALKPINIR